MINQTLTKISGVISNALTRERVCEGCGKEFSCGANLTGCWCREIDLSDEARAALKSAYRDCLCRECLNEAAAKDESKNPAALKSTL